MNTLARFSDRTGGLNHPPASANFSIDDSMIGESRMNYEKIYSDFISDRRAKPTHDGCTENHHIIPRAYGGKCGDNLISLRPSDHFFAHILLAKIYGGKMWCALFLMAQLKSRAAKGVYAKRHIYELARKKHAENNTLWNSGENNGMFDSKKYHLVNLKKDDEFRGTRREFSKYTGIDHRKLNCIFSSRNDSYQFWNLKESEHKLYVNRPAHNEDHHIYILENESGKLISGTRSELSGIIGKDIRYLLKGSNKTASGWWVFGEKPLHYGTGQNQVQSKKVVCVETGMVFDTLISAARFVGISQGSKISDVCRGRRKTTGGYHWKFVK